EASARLLGILCASRNLPCRPPRREVTSGREWRRRRWGGTAGLNCRLHGADTRDEPRRWTRRPGSWDCGRRGARTGRLWLRAQKIGRELAGLVRIRDFLRL